MGHVANNYVLLHSEKAGATIKDCTYQSALGRERKLSACLKIIINFYNFLLFAIKSNQEVYKHFHLKKNIKTKNER